MVRVWLSAQNVSASAKERSEQIAMYIVVAHIKTCLSIFISLADMSISNKNVTAGRAGKIYVSKLWVEDRR